MRLDYNCKAIIKYNLNNYRLEHLREFVNIWLLYNTDTDELVGAFKTKKDALAYITTVKNC